MPNQQSLRGRSISLLVVRARTTNLDDLLVLIPELLRALDILGPGQAGRIGVRWTLSHRLPRERLVGEHLRNVRIVMPVPIPRPARARVQHFPIPAQLLKTRTIDAPHIEIGRAEEHTSEL